MTINNSLMSYLVNATTLIPGCINPMNLQDATLLDIAAKITLLDTDMPTRDPPQNAQN